MTSTSELLSASVDAKSRAAIRHLQRALDSVRKKEREVTLGLLTRGNAIMIPGMPFWAWRCLTLSQRYLERGVEGCYQVAEEHLYRAVKLTSELGPTGELCMVSIKNFGEEKGIKADLQVTSRDGAWEPVPICEENEREAITTWKIQDPVVEPLVPIWPPWSIPPTWGNRRGNIFSHDRYAYAAFQKAMEGDVDGAFFTAMCFETGCGLTRSAEGAIHFYKIAAKEEYPGAQEGVERCDRKAPWPGKTPVDSNEEEEVPWWQS